MLENTEKYEIKIIRATGAIAVPPDRSIILWCCCTKCTLHHACIRSSLLLHWSQGLHQYIDPMIFNSHAYIRTVFYILYHIYAIVNIYVQYISVYTIYT